MARRGVASLFIVIVVLTSVAYSAGIVIPPSGNGSTLGSSDQTEFAWGSNPSIATMPYPGQGAGEYGAWQGFVDLNPELQVDEALGKHMPSSMASWWRINGYIDGDMVRIIIGTRGAGSLTSAQISDLLIMYGGTIANTISLYGRLVAIVAELPMTSVSAFAGEAYSRGLIGYAEPDMKVQATALPDDPSWTLQWGPQKIQADWAWNTTRGDHSLLVAVLDTGIAYGHPDIAPNYAPIGYNWVYNSRNPMDDHGHGTHCAGIIAAVINNSVGIAGIAQVQVMAEKVLDSGGAGYWDWVANGIINATDAGAKIISMSLGGAGDSQLVHDAIKYAYAHGVLIIAAAGNSNSNQLFYPAGYDEVVSVAATDQNDDKAYFSNWGDKIELAAPGVSVYSTVPSGYSYMSGTSMACPHVSGVAALALCKFPEKSGDWIRLWLRYTADDLGAPGFDPYFGYGRVNARNAVEQVPPTHELILTGVEKPRHVQPGDNVIFNASVLNFGSQDEDNLQVQFLLNRTIIDSVLISHLGNCSSTEISLFWNPSVEAVYNVTIYIVPVSGEVRTNNNVETDMIRIRVASGFVLIDQSHYNNAATSYSILEGNISDRGYIVDTLTKSPIDSSLLQGYNVFIVPDALYPYSANEIAAIRSFVLTGGSILIMGNYYTSTYGALTSFAGIEWNNTQVYFFGNTTGIARHAVTDGVSTAYFGSTPLELLVRHPASPIIIRGNGHTNVLLAISQAGAGRVACIADNYIAQDSYISRADNIRLFNNIVDWLSMRTRYQHQLVVYLDAPTFLGPGSSYMLGATVYNVGLSNETDIELQILVNGTVVKDVVEPELSNGTSFGTTYLWAPSMLGWYNLTAYAPPVVGENTTAFNVMTKLAHVMYPLIQPEPGQYTNYAVEVYGMGGGPVYSTYYINFTYDHYVRSDAIYVNIFERSPDNFTYTAYSIVNIFTRYVEDGAYVGYYYPWWIETGLSIDSAVNIVNTVTNVNGSKYVLYHQRPVDCWQLPLYGFENMYYDKVHGLLMELTFSFGSMGEYMRLLDTNVPLNTTYSHELGVSLETPHSLLLGRSATLNATVYNFGQNAETNIALSIIISGMVVDSVNIPNLLNGTSYTISYVWSPAQKGTYLVETRVAPVPGETDTDNNDMISTAIVFYYGRVYVPPEWQSGGVSTGAIGSDFGFPWYLPYPISFCGQEFQTIWISSNGLITFLSYDASYGNTLSSLSTKLAIAPAWSHWVVPSTGGIYTLSDNSFVGVRWSVASYYDSSVTANFEVIVRRGGAIRFNYGQCTGSLSATVGISDGRGFILAENKTYLNYFNTTVFADDLIPPATITDLATIFPSDFSIFLQFTAPGNDGLAGTATGYIVKYSTLGPITSANWNQATTYYQTWTPYAGGRYEVREVNNLNTGTTYWFAVEAFDDVPWYGGVSNSPSGTTTDLIPPAAIGDLAIVNVTSTSVTLTWTAVGDNGLVGCASGYIVKYSTKGTISGGSFNSATTYPQSWTPQTAGSTEIYEIKGLQSNTTYWFAVKSYDAAMNYGMVSNSPKATTQVGPPVPLNTSLLILISIVSAIAVGAVVGVIVLTRRRSSARVAR